jgi:5'-nucleotidase / UDP-sugar diphosphatase
MRTQGTGVRADRGRVGLVGFLVIALMVALLPPPASAQVAGFPDVRTTNVHAEAIAELAEAGILLGFADGTYGPAKTITRAQMASVLARTEGLPARPANFTDVRAGSTHAGAIGALAELGIIQGYEDGTFRPYEPIRRDHAAVMIARWLELDAVATGPFTDLVRYSGQINALHELGIVQGTSTTTFEPSRNIRRDQTASLIRRALRVMGVDFDVFQLSVLHINDGESALLPDAGSGFPGAARFVADLKWEQEQALRFSHLQERAQVTISAGDNYLAGPRLNASRETDGVFYDALVYTEGGFDSMTLGNHEFDFGPELLAEFIEAVPDVPFVSANLDFSGEPSLAALETEGRLAASTVIERDGREIGVIGATYEDLDVISSPGAVTASDVLEAVQQEADTLTAEGVEIILLSSHLQNLDTEIELVPDLSNIDAVIGGGGGEALDDDYPVMVEDADGKDVPVVTVPGNYTDVGRLVLHFDDDGDLVGVLDGWSPWGSGLQPVAMNGPRDAFIAEFVEVPVAAYVAELADNVIATSQVPLDGRRGRDADGAVTERGVRNHETNLGNLMADAHLEAARDFAAANAGVPVPDIALQNGGGMRSDTIHEAGDITELDTFNIAAFSNFIAIGEITAEELLEALEHSVSAQPLSAGFHGQWAGITFNFDVTEPVGSRIQEAIVTRGDGDSATDTPLVEDGALVAGAESFVIASIDFILRDGGDGYESLAVPITTTTISYQESLAQWFRDLGTVTSADYPDVSVNVSEYTRFGPSDEFPLP